MHTDLKFLQGLWYITSLEVDGAAVAPAGEIVVIDERFESIGMGAVYSGALEINPRTKPKGLSLRFKDGPEKGNVNRGIYELVPGGWRLCLSMTGGPAPKTFATTAGSGLALETLARTGPTAAPVADAPVDGQWQMVACIRDGAPLEAMMLKTGRRVVTGDRVKVLFGKQVFMEATFVVAGGEIDYTLAAGPNHGKRQFGLVVEEGETVKMIFAAPGQPRPADFATAPGDGKTFTTWRRV